MKILILSSNPAQGNPKFDADVCQMMKAIKDNLTKGNRTPSISHLDLKTLNLKDCIGCYACWLKTPGVCALKDDMGKVLEAFVKADVVVHASPVKIGFVSPLCKRIRDRLLPVVHPYLKIDGDRMSHVSRYDNLPKQIVVLDTVKNIDHIKSMYGTRGQNGNHIYSISNLEGIINAITSY